MGRRAFRRAVSDAALGMFGPILQYKTERTGAKVITADRWFASSQIHHGCGCRLVAPSKLARQLVCAVTGVLVDRDRNASFNLRDWPETNASPGLVEASAPVDPGPPAGGTDPGSDTGISRRRRSDRQTHTLTGRAGRGEAITNPAERRARNPERGAA
jgi:putative transposase